MVDVSSLELTVGSSGDKSGTMSVKDKEVLGKNVEAIATGLKVDSGLRLEKRRSQDVFLHRSQFKLAFLSQKWGNPQIRKSGW